MGHPDLLSPACDIRRRTADSNINKARLNNSDVPFLPREYMFFIFNGGEYIAFCFDCAPPACFYQT